MAVPSRASHFLLLVSFVFHSRYLKTQEYLSCGYSLPSLSTISPPDRTVRFLLSEVSLYILLKNHEAREIYDKHFPLKFLSVLHPVLPRNVEVVAQSPAPESILLLLLPAKTHASSTLKL